MKTKEKAIGDQIRDLGAIALGERLVFVKKVRAAYLITIDDELYYQREVRDREEDVAVIRVGVDRKSALADCKSLPAHNR